jgi:hypothetical protein
MMHAGVEGASDLQINFLGPPRPTCIVIGHCTAGAEQRAKRDVSGDVPGAAQAADAEAFGV